MITPIVVGAVVYDPKVSVIWEIISEFFEARNCPIDLMFYSNYDLQVTALLEHDIDIAWNSPLAWLYAQRESGGKCRAIAMRDTDRDRSSYIIVKKNSGINSLVDLRGKTIAVGAKDSPQATLIPLGFLLSHGRIAKQDMEVKRSDVLVGKHGDHIGGELNAFQILKQGDANASTMIDLNWDRWSMDGTISSDEYQILAATDAYDHCVFTVLEDFPSDRQNDWFRVLNSMNYDNPKHRDMMDMEGLKKWLPGRVTGFGQLDFAVNELNFFDEV